MYSLTDKKPFYNDNLGLRHILCSTVGYSDFNPEYDKDYIPGDRLLLEYRILKFPLSEDYTIHHRENVMANCELHNLFILTQDENEAVQEILKRVIDEKEERGMLIDLLYEQIQTLSNANVSKIQFLSFIKDLDTKYETLKRKVKESLNSRQAVKEGLVGYGPSSEEICGEEDGFSIVKI